VNFSRQRPLVAELGDGLVAAVEAVRPQALLLSALVAPLAVGLAVLVQSGATIVTAQTWLTLLFVVIAGPVLAHATIRAARIREKGDWRSGRGGASSQPSSRRGGSGASGGSQS